jgi:hypothetical protein
MSDYPPALVEAVAVELADVANESWVFESWFESGRNVYRRRAVDLLDLIEREGALYRKESGPSVPSAR